MKMKGPKLGGSSRPPSIDTPKPPPVEAKPKPTETPKAPPTAAPTAPPRDGFSTRPPASSAPVAQPQARPPGGKDVTTPFAQDPMKFAGQKDNVLNIQNTQRPAGIPAATAQQPFVPASDSIATLSVHQRPGGNANMHLSPAGGKGTPAYYLDYLPEGSGRFAGLQGVPQHPGPNDPKLLVTGQLNGCAVHALHDSRDQSLSFLHHANYSKNGQQELTDFLRDKPHLSPAATFGPQDYSHKTGNGQDLAGATAFAQYRPPHNGQGLGQWHLMGQLNDMTGKVSPDMRPELMRPDKLQGVPPVMMLPVPYPQTPSI
ncbi:hypothetical protein [Melittangium boletus]|uniref:hypothetical protein n=1 Tax=Melittangium boletus TaxID=83453 RepID=UPI003DA266FE